MSITKEAVPQEMPKVEELGTTSAPLKSAAFFLGAHCREYTEDFMLCKAENRDPGHCLKEGRRVTRCATDLCVRHCYCVATFKPDSCARITKMRENCLEQYESHWGCLEQNNHQYYRCRPAERTLNTCMFEKLGLLKVIPGTPEGRKPIHEIESPVLKRQQK
ncbi:NADH dehydrogenase alpha subcomplex subunit 8 [Mycena crocata]|nr:NADH dehydrogenase alpha subcomplex subunit 8 [Mycena crocata]